MLQAWVYASAPASPGQSILELSDSPTSSVMSLFLAYGGKTVYAVDNRPDAGAVRAELVSPFALPRLRWTHVAVTHSASTASLLWDGVVVVRPPLPPPPGPWAGFGSPSWIIVGCLGFSAVAVAAVAAVASCRALASGPIKPHRTLPAFSRKRFGPACAGWAAGVGRLPLPCTAKPTVPGHRQRQRERRLADLPGLHRRAVCLAHQPNRRPDPGRHA